MDIPFSLATTNLLFENRCEATSSQKHNESMATAVGDAQGMNAGMSMFYWDIENHGDDPASFTIHAYNFPGINTYN
ncbi:hypothetical protein DPMN_168539 [Dreissena polymorpha]|uniref:Uncharacterized protein n=1 Tax=Dreissena polymorpha TaxID=45954 RepID=A0A9D4IW08_DREPO|nr:hypothetical protein DPMN_168539 [Dreissena polymorpha]